MFPLVPPLPAFDQANAPYLMETVRVGKGQNSNQKKVIQYPGLTIEAMEITENLETGLVRASGGVVATFGETKLTANELVIDQLKESFTATGDVVMHDPEGELSAQSFTYGWTSATGSGDDVKLRVGTVSISGGHMAVKPGATPEKRIYQIENASLMLTDLGSSNGLTAERLTIYPGERAVAERVTFNVLNVPIGPISTYTFNLDERVSGFNLPEITNRRGLGLGITINGSFLIDKQNAFAYSMGVFPSAYPSWEGRVIRSFLPSDEDPSQISPRSDLGERAERSYLSDVRVNSLEEEYNYLRSPKDRISIATAFNVQTYGREPEAKQVSKAFEVTYERGNKYGAFGYLATLDFHRIRPDGQSGWTDRLYGIFTVGGPKVEISPGLFFTSRADMIGTLSEDNAFAIARAEAGLVAKIGDSLTIGGAYVLAEEMGQPDFDFDQLGYGNALHGRIDLRFEGLKLSVLTKYNLRTHDWFDTEYELAYAMGSFEPFLVRREFPSDFRIGVRLRLDSFRSLLDRDFGPTK